MCPEDPRWPTAEQGAGRDIRITLPRDRVCQPKEDADGRLVSELGGTPENPAHNIWVTGGKVVNVHGQGNLKTDKGSALLRFRNVAGGKVMVEGVHFDGRGTCEDLVNMVEIGPDVRFVFQNIYAEGAGHCGKGGTHGDFIQNQGWGKPVPFTQPEVKVENATVRVLGQGTFLSPRNTGHGVSRLVLDHVTFVAEDRLQNPDRKKGIGWVMVWQDPNTPGAMLPRGGVRLLDVHIDRNGKSVPYPSWPTPIGERNGCARYGPGSGVTEGTWCWGRPKDGLPVDPDMVGLSYDRSAFLGLRVGTQGPSDRFRRRVVDFTIPEPRARALRDKLEENQRK
ncbi:MAG: hypothetical protein JNM75_12940 [Rhodospirillales bacterium]|nr:hypothetical protein [Rhodospirillales bacterium]